jgi:hypothetical protein
LQELAPFLERMWVMNIDRKADLAGRNRDGA